MFLESLEGQAFQDAKMLILGYFIVLLYVLVMLGTFRLYIYLAWLKTANSTERVQFYRGTPHDPRYPWKD